MTKSLKEWAKEFNNIEGTDAIDDCRKELEESGVVCVYGASDDLCVMVGAFEDEFDCYNGAKLYWNGATFFNYTRKDEFLDYVDNEYPEFLEMIVKMFERDDSNISYIDIKDGHNYQFDYDTNIPCERFDILEDGEPVYQGLLFYKKDLIA